jgi:hypothetical protein
MAVLMTQEIPATKEQYDQVNQKLGVDDNPPDGLMIHTAQDHGDHMRIVDVWESQQAYETFRNERLGPAVEEVVGPAPEGAAPQNEFHELYNVIRP